MDQVEPDKFIDGVRDALPLCTRTEGARLLRQAGAWAIVFFQGNVPAEVRQKLKGATEKWRWTKSRCG